MESNNKKYEYSVAGCAHEIAPILTRIAILSYSEKEAIEIPECLPFQSGWGINNSISLTDESCFPLPKGIHIIYLSTIEKQFYKVDAKLPYETIFECFEKTDNESHEHLYNRVLVGMAPYGVVAVWLNGKNKQKLICCIQGQNVELTMNQFLPENPYVKIEDLCNFYVNSSTEAKEYVSRYGMPSKQYFNKKMAQYSYRYQILFCDWCENDNVWHENIETNADNAKFGWVEDFLFDGSYDKVHDEALMKYHIAGKPIKLAIRWYVKKSEYTSFFWFDEEELMKVFDRFYGTHVETKTDIVIRIDYSKKVYELSLYRYGLSKPVIIPQSAYQLIVFKSGFENYRSSNYSQPTGAWIW